MSDAVIAGVRADRLAGLHLRESNRFAQTRPKAKAALVAGADAFLDGVPLHWMRDWSMPHLPLIAKAKGARITDIDGYQIDDFCLGDTGSMFIGFILSALVIEVMASDYPTYIKTIQPSNVPHLLIGMLYIPVFDSIRIFIARASEGKSPFAPDRTHIHHLLMDYHGWNHRKTASTIVVMNVGICLLVWQTAVHAPQWLVVTVLLGIGIGLSLYLRNLRRVIEVRKVVKAKKESKN